MTEVTVDPVILTYAVRYALGRATYAPDDVCASLRRNWDLLGDQREVIADEIRDWLWEARTDVPGNDPRRRQWTELFAWFNTRGAAS